VRARAYPPVWRAVAGVLVAVSRGSLPIILLLVVTASDPPVTPPVLFVLVTVLAAVPGVAAWFIGRGFAAQIEAPADGLVIRRPGWQLEVPWPAITEIIPWVIPLPGLGLAFRLGSGRRLPCVVAVDDPGLLLAELAERGGVRAARAAAAHPSVVYGRARAAMQRRRWYHWVGRFPLFALLPTGVLFNAHQHIAYGGTFGQYYLVGLAAYLRTFGVYWATVTIYVVLYAAVLRAVAEALALIAAWAAPRFAAPVRHAVETASQILYYVGVPLLLALRFLA
jgi:hypothetical protein